MDHAGAAYWDGYFKNLRDVGDDLDWGDQWVAPFLPPLSESGARTVLELGSGTGNDAARLARHGYRVTAVDVSFEAARWAASRYGCNIDFAVVDIAAGLPFLDERFDAVMSNVALHMFADDITRYLFREIGRVVRPGGLLLAHVNATEDRPLRARRLPVIRELGPDYVLEHSGQTTHFFSDAYARQLLVQWATIETTLVEILDPDTDEPFKRVRRVIARR